MLFVSVYVICYLYMYMLFVHVIVYVIWERIVNIYNIRSYNVGFASSLISIILKNIQNETPIDEKRLKGGNSYDIAVSKICNFSRFHIALQETCELIWRINKNNLKVAETERQKNNFNSKQKINSVCILHEIDLCQVLRNIVSNYLLLINVTGNRYVCSKNRQ